MSEIAKELQNGGNVPAMQVSLKSTVTVISLGFRSLSEPACHPHADRKASGRLYTGRLKDFTVKKFSAGFWCVCH
ncbi:hypothetical protein ACFX19_043588 [Malus domestica]